MGRGKDKTKKSRRRRWRRVWYRRGEWRGRIASKEERDQEKMKELAARGDEENGRKEENEKRKRRKKEAKRIAGNRAKREMVDEKERDRKHARIKEYRKRQSVNIQVDGNGDVERERKTIER